MSYHDRIVGNGAGLPTAETLVTPQVGANLDLTIQPIETLELADSLIVGPSEQERIERKQIVDAAPPRIIRSQTQSDAFKIKERKAKEQLAVVLADDTVDTVDDTADPGADNNGKLAFSILWLFVILSFMGFGRNVNV